jgi:hypothetical protein
MRFFDWDADLSDDERDRLIEALVEKVHRYRMESAAIFFLEMHKPLTYVASQSMLLGSGFLAPLFGPENVQKYSKLFEHRENVERLIRRIEENHAQSEAVSDPNSNPILPS